MDSANTTADMVNCNAKQTKVQDDPLNRAYKTALAAQDGARIQ
ncbi:lysozyme inhibitor LprI family protein [Vibrio cholerae]